MPQRHTLQKSIIYSAVCRLKNHPTADAVYQEIHAEHPSISRSTVYRALHQMSESGQLQKVRMCDGADCFDHDITPHCHARCKRCGKIFDLFYDTPPVAGIENLMTDGFEITDYYLQLEGVCRRCSKNIRQAEDENGQ